MGRTTSPLLPLFGLVLLFAFISSATAFGAGNIPAFSFLEGRAFRHGDIEDILATVLKKTGLFGGSKFGGLDIKRIYFGNWLRDYSQAMDLAGLQKLSRQSILNLVMGLGFLAHGYATAEFEVTEERLGVYRPEEHIDNPAGYAKDEPGQDARRTDARLRGPVTARELEVDLRTGMKNYIANDQGDWDTSSKFVRHRIKQCIEMGRRAKASGNNDELYETYRLLGTFLHTLEDFTAHSNWCELSLIRMGHTGVFAHVGDSCRIATPNGPAPPLVTGTFGGADFIHSLLGETADKISSASVSDLNIALDDSVKTRGAQSEPLKKMLIALPSNGNELNNELDHIDQQITRSRATGQEMSPQELHATMWKVLKFRDNVVKTLERTIEAVGLSSVVESITNALTKWIFSALEPLLRPLIATSSSVLLNSSSQVLESSDQYAVFDQPYSDAPTHSFLAKDHFANALNGAAGKVAMVVIKSAVEKMVAAWEDVKIDPDQVASQILETFHHPFFFNPQSKVQTDMASEMAAWLDSHSPDQRQYLLRVLSKASVRAHENVRQGLPDSMLSRGGGCSHTPRGMDQGQGQGQQHQRGIPPPGTFDQQAQFQNQGYNPGYDNQQQSYAQPPGPPPFQPQSFQQQSFQQNQQFDQSNQQQFDQWGNPIYSQPSGPPQFFQQQGGSNWQGGGY